MARERGRREGKHFCFVFFAANLSLHSQRPMLRNRPYFSASHSLFFPSVSLSRPNHTGKTILNTHLSSKEDEKWRGKWLNAFIVLLRLHTQLLDSHARYSKTLFPSSLPRPSPTLKCALPLPDTPRTKDTCRRAKEKEKTMEEKKDDTNRSFGVPTVRTDISKPKVRKVTSNQNFGDDATAKMLLNPNQFTDGGCGELEFLARVSKEDMRATAAKPSYDVGKELFEEWWEKATSYTESGAVSYATFSRAVDELGY